MSERVQIPINASEEQLKVFATCACSLIREQVPMHPNVSDEILWQLHKDPDRYVRQAVVWSPKVTVELLDVMAEDGDEMVRAAVAASKKASLESLTKLAKEREWITLREVARNPNTPSEVLYDLADRVSYLVDDAILQNPNVTDEIILKLTTVSRNIAIALEILERESLPQEVFSIFARHYHEDIRLKVASDSRTSGKDLEKLATDWSNTIRFEVAKNPNVLKETLYILIVDPDRRVYEAAANRLQRM